MTIKQEQDLHENTTKVIRVWLSTLGLQKFQSLLAKEIYFSRPIHPDFLNRLKVSNKTNVIPAKGT